MKGVWRTLAVIALLVAAAIGAGLVAVGLTGRVRTATYTEEALFPDFSQVGPRDDAASGVRIRFVVTTLQPWLQGSLHEVEAVLETLPGSDVTDVGLTTLFLYVARPRLPNPDYVTGDLVLLEESGAGTWISADGPFRIAPNPEYIGDAFFLTFSLSLNVEYADGTSYGYGGWATGLRLAPVRIVQDAVPLGVPVLGTAVAGLVFFLLATRSVRNRSGRPKDKSSSPDLSAMSMSEIKSRSGSQGSWRSR